MLSGVGGQSDSTGGQLGCGGEHYGDGVGVGQPEQGGGGVGGVGWLVMRGAEKW